VTSTLKRASGFAAVGSLALAAPALGSAAAVPFAAVAVLAVFVVDEGPIFELFARPGDYEDGRLNGLAGFSLAATALAVLTAVPRFRLPVTVFVASVVLLSYGNLGEKLVGVRSNDPFVSVAGFGVVGFAAALGAQVAVTAAVDGVQTLPRFAFLAGAGVLVAALLRSILYARDDPLVMLTTAFLLWFFDTVAVDVTAVEVLVALGVTVAFGYAAYLLGAASVTGMLTGVLLGLLLIVFGGYGWFAVLITFFSVGGLSTKFRYETKSERGVAEENEGARGTGNVLGNAAVALLAVLGFAASGSLPVPAVAFRFAFAGSMAAAMSDTLSSELGSLFDGPRLITTFEPVPPGTDGGVTWQGELFGLVGALLVAVVAVVALGFPTPTLAGAIIVVGGFVGMTVDSLLGATLEGERIGNQAVNFGATLSGALVSAAAALLWL
jgi:uncharacterized protein (TIGR00297 family)